ncbi:putative aminopeptidase, putative,metallo-peptidase, Clan MF, Family M17 [Trypanosoma rangeli]|uniref:Putative aminopeptidase, putative,metallo-peptidase, Clan MF, Family M17 n=1 Tax=Trypanosoma rangeli TaxID=5698 RepID=A0A3R7N130_TRYRA|nr:putative aminopeptidase, putative,metallo-peptidase, Clan MF, Family M17 [Trypanosoma rangeli]RNF11098.1 putative aminopeptidase, putative,metallo-peptidase, Clan MF, Family M17 [Trypanosoma rangeli]|eukprot:RNF11098.1 putative aminopeptidase, putative,metallo-peptidase, Clan MF, Family M17 [Trypanosoma rangeli]
MSSVYKRQRTTSEYEELSVSAFVESCINFKTNLSFHTTAEGKQLANEAMRSTPQQPNIVLLLGNEKQLQDKKALSSFFPYYSNAVASAINVAATGQNYVAEITPHARILVGMVPTKASRHNCPSRPDVVSTLVKDAITQARRVDGENSSFRFVDIYCCESENELCIATVVARSANRSFSAKRGRAENGYVEAGLPVRVFFAPNTTKLTLTEAENTFACGSRHALEVAALVVQLCQRLVDAPTNLLDTTTFTEIASGHLEKLRAQGRNVSIDIIGGEELREKGYGGLYGVGKAAEFPPHLVTLSYHPSNVVDPQEKLAFVGKGIVYDTGGLSIKTSGGMCNMKHDMGGAAAVFCGFIGLAMLEVPHMISSLLCLADNAVGPRSQRNDDIIRMKSGRTVEVNNTDAEGRLVLGDGVYHASALLSYTPNIIVDMATLTGAQGVATGRAHAALYANNEEIENRILRASRICGDLCFPILHCPEFHSSEFTSNIADSRNSVANRGNATASCAAYFIGTHIDAKYKGSWAHIDMASPVSREEATGFGVALLLQTFAPSFNSSVGL